MEYTFRERMYGRWWLFQSSVLVLWGLVLTKLALLMANIYLVELGWYLACKASEAKVEAAKCTVNVLRMMMEHNER